MKRFVSILFVLVLVCTLVLTACGGKSGSTENNETKVLTVAELWTKASEKARFGAMTAVPRSDWSDIYGVDTAKVEDAVWYMSENPSLNADEMAIFKLNDASYAETLAGIFRDRIARQKEVAIAYSPVEATKLDKAEVVVAGNYVYYCVGEAGEAVTALMKTLVK